jgi:hypothetical protein
MFINQLEWTQLPTKYHNGHHHGIECECQLRTKVGDKIDYFHFVMMQFPLISSNIPDIARRFIQISANKEA